jgi:aryl-alcohol dehydrogenase-like predicted oxidoreductase
MPNPQIGGLKLEYRTLGKSGLKVSLIGFGCFPIGGTVKYWPSAEEDAKKAIHRALDAGINCFDTARVYGISEEMLAEVIQPKSGEVVIVTKCGLLRKPETSGHHRDSRPEAIRRSVEESLRRLKTDCLDVLLIHWPDENTPVEDSMVEMNKLLDEGKTRHIGVSNFKRPLLDRANGLAPVTANEISYNMLDRGPEEATMPFSEDSGIGILTHGTLAYGWLAGQIGPDTKFSDEVRSRGHPDGLPFFEENHFESTRKAVGELKSIAERNGGTLPQLAVRWQRRQTAVSSALIGFRRPSEVDEAVNALDWKLPESELDAADAIGRSAYERMKPDQIPWPPPQPPHVPGLVGEAV